MSAAEDQVVFPERKRPKAPKRLGRYELLAQLGTGGMANVWLARMSGPSGFVRHFAIKRVHPHLVEQRDFLDMFLDEARIAAAIHHPHVAQVFELAEDDEGAPYLVMEYLHGEHLGAVLKAQLARGPFPIELACEIVACTAEGLHHAHEARGPDGTPLEIVHRDVTPQNVFLTYDGAVKLTDFGVAKAAGRLVRTSTGTVKGKLAYMSPEQVQGRPLDRRADVFALGVVLHEAIAGKRLFKGENDADTILRVLSAPIPALREKRADCPAELEAIVARAVHRDPAERYATAAELAEALRGFLRGRREHGTSALVAFLADLFRERIAERTALLRSGSTPLEPEREAPEASRTIPSRHAPAGAIAESAPATSASVGTASSEVRLPRASPPWAAIVAVLLGAGAIAASTAWLGGGGEAATATAPETAREPEPVPEPVPEAAPEPVPVLEPERVLEAVHEPEPVPEAVPEPVPVHEPVPEAAPEPVPALEPALEHEPAPEPVPERVPGPDDLPTGQLPPEAPPAPPVERRAPRQVVRAPARPAYLTLYAERVACEAQVGGDPEVLELPTRVLEVPAGVVRIRFFPEDLEPFVRRVHIGPGERARIPCTRP